jgi:hypothetical protein
MKSAAMTVKEDKLRLMIRQLQQMKMMVSKMKDNLQHDLSKELTSKPPNPS